SVRAERLLQQQYRIVAVLRVELQIGDALEDCRTIEAVAAGDDGGTVRVAWEEGAHLFGIVSIVEHDLYNHARGLRAEARCTFGDVGRYLVAEYSQRTQETAQDLPHRR